MNGPETGEGEREGAGASGPGEVRGRTGGRRRFGGAVASALLFVALAICGADWLRHRLSHVEEDDAKTQGEVINIASRLDGWLLTRKVMEGDAVRKGQVLGEIDSRDARLRLAAVEGNIDAHDAQISETTIEHDLSRRSTQADVAVAQAQVAAAQAAMAEAQHQDDLARSDFERDNGLVGQGGISRQEWEHARTALLERDASLRQAQAQIEVRRAELLQAQAQLAQADMLEQRIKILRAERAALAAQADQLRQEVADRVLRAPSDGVIDGTFVHAGDYAQAGQWLMMMHDPGDVWVEANIKETKVGRVKVGQPAAVHVDAYPSLAFQGKVVRVGNAATNQFALLPSPNPSGNFTKISQRVPVRIALLNPRRPLQPGLMAEVSIDVRE